MSCWHKTIIYTFYIYLNIAFNNFKMLTWALEKKCSSYNWNHIPSILKYFKQVLISSITWIHINKYYNCLSLKKIIIILCKIIN